MAFVSLQMLSILPFYGNNEEIRAEERMRDSVGWVSYVVRSANAFSIQVSPCSIHKMNEECVVVQLYSAGQLSGKLSHPPTQDSKPTTLWTGAKATYTRL